MKICIYGAGAIGGYLGVQLARSGADVSMVARGRTLEAIRANGLKLLIGDEERTARQRVSDRPADLGPQDYVIVALKSHQAWETAEQFKPLLGPDTAVVTAQNGVPWWYFYKLEGSWKNRQIDSVDAGGRQWRAIGPERAIGCVVFPATEAISPGVIKHVYGDKFTLGEPDGTLSPRCNRLSGILISAGLQAPVRDNIRDDIWKKLWGNLCFNLISALTQATLDVVATDPDTRALARAMMLEAKEIGEKLGVEFRIDIEKRIDGAAEVGAHKTSMLQDLLAGRAMEIDALVTAVQELGRLTGTATPCLDAVLALVKLRGMTAGLYSAAPAPAATRAA
ncbi:MAG: 2-dehydropantoate 2-reductase [Rhodospirillales bacterium]|nr:2-dehydropantoate 2-reductase [Rhodospirillales bacterium]